MRKFTTEELAQALLQIIDNKDSEENKALEVEDDYIGQGVHYLTIWSRHNLTLRAEGR